MESHTLTSAQISSIGVRSGWYGGQLKTLWPAMFISASIMDYLNWSSWFWINLYNLHPCIYDSGPGQQHHWSSTPWVKRRIFAAQTSARVNAFRLGIVRVYRPFPFGLTSPKNQVRPVHLYYVSRKYLAGLIIYYKLCNKYFQMTHKGFETKIFFLFFFIFLRNHIIKFCILRTLHICNLIPVKTFIQTITLYLKLWLRQILDSFQTN